MRLSEYPRPPPFSEQDQTFDAPSSLGYTGLPIFENYILEQPIFPGAEKIRATARRREVPGGPRSLSARRGVGVSATRHRPNRSQTYSVGSPKLRHDLHRISRCR